MHHDQLRGKHIVEWCNLEPVGKTICVSLVELVFSMIEWNMNHINLLKDQDLPVEQMRFIVLTCQKVSDNIIENISESRTYTCICKM